MKANTVSTARYYACKQPGAARYPNAASKRYYLEKLVDGALALALTLASVIIALVLITL